MTNLTLFSCHYHDQTTTFFPKKIAFKTSSMTFTRHAASLLFFLLFFLVDLSQSKKPRPPISIYKPYEWHTHYDAECIQIISNCRSIDVDYLACMQQTGCEENTHPQCKESSKVCEALLVNCIANFNPSHNCMGDYMQSPSP